MLIYHPLIGGTVQWAMIGQTVKWVIIGRMRAWIFNGMTSQQLWHVGVALPPQAPLRILTGLRPPNSPSPPLHPHPHRARAVAATATEEVPQSIQRENNCNAIPLPL